MTDLINGTRAEDILACTLMATGRCRHCASHDVDVLWTMVCDGVVVECGGAVSRMGVPCRKGAIMAQENSRQGEIVRSVGRV